ncbi:hypothetical protein EIK77_010334 [Talaromyces pinophilus]|nr:hypothetical protein EIK77_010334 [Talaromyces pinophilus]
MRPKRSKKGDPKGGPATKKGKLGHIEQSSDQNSSHRDAVAEKNQSIEESDHDSDDGSPFQKLLSQRILDMEYQDDSDSEVENSITEAGKGQLKGEDSIADRRMILKKLSPAELHRSIKTWTDCAAATPTITSVQELKKWDFSVDRSKWTATDWSASALQRIFEEDEAQPDGLWDSHIVSPDRKYVVLYAIFSVFIKECAPSRLAKTWPSLGISPEKEKELRIKFPHLNNILDESSEAKNAQDEERRLHEAATNALLELSQEELAKQKEKAQVQSKRNTRSSLPTKNREAISDSVGRAVKAKIAKRRKNKDGKAEEPEADGESEPTDIASTAWQDEFSQPTRWIPLRRKSKELNVREPFWSNRLISVALNAVDIILERDSSQECEVEATQNPATDADQKLETAAIGFADMNAELADAQGQAENLLNDGSEVPQATTNDDVHAHAHETSERAVQPEIEDLLKSTERTAIFKELGSFLQEGDMWREEIQRADAECADADGVDKAPLAPASIIQTADTSATALQEIDSLADNPDLQRDDLDAAIKALSVEQSGDVYKVPGMRANRQAFKWQILAAHAALEAFKDPDFTGHLNADDVGLGKTWSTLSFLLPVSHNT